MKTIVLITILLSLTPAMGQSYEFLAVVEGFYDVESTTQTKEKALLKVDADLYEGARGRCNGQIELASKLKLKDRWSCSFCYPFRTIVLSANFICTPD